MPRWSRPDLEYEAGVIGVTVDPVAEGEFDRSHEFTSFAEVGESIGLREGGAEPLLPGVSEAGLYLPFLAHLHCDASRYNVTGTLAELSCDDRINPYHASQTTGDCVSHFCANLAMVTNSCEIYSGESEQFKPLACEPAYGYRGHRGQGANCSRLLDFYSTVSGAFSRELHEVDGYGTLDLRKYDATTGMVWGSSGVPEAVIKYGRSHSVRDVTRCNTRDEIIAAFRNGLAGGGCSSMGFERKLVPWKGQTAVAKPRGSWSHAMAFIGLDVRETTVASCGGLVLIQNSWGPRWISGDRRIRNTPYLIPRGAFFASLDHVVRHAGGFYTMSGVNGWQLPLLQDFGNRW